ncbi:MFSD5-like protein [Mya arenaria]|uniref:MFSD5-like protein n=1 Tax=Mya arenaria TaxID=6604 RepID=A0ABY7FUS3_MYAAR|nr:MFSD5-like protein [Mya arenaria]
MNIFLNGFFLLCVICAILFVYTRQKVTAVTDVGFQQFQRTYLVVYMLAMVAEETTVSCTEFCMVLHHFNNFWILMLGRLLGGTATSILYSAFESWLVFEHNKRGFDSDLLGNIFSHAILGNSLVAIASGMVAQFFADGFGFVAPFDLSLTVLIVMCGIIIYTWPENYGNQSVNVAQSMKNAAQAIKSDHKVLCLGLIQSLFEGSMYVFVLEWTPALTPNDPSSVAQRKLLGADDDADGHRGQIPHGHIFAGFMVSIMIGSSLFKLLSKFTSVESFMRPVLFVAAMTLATPILFPGNQLVIFMAFIVFEITSNCDELLQNSVKHDCCDDIAAELQSLVLKRCNQEVLVFDFNRIAAFGYNSYN